MPNITYDDVVTAITNLVTLGKKVTNQNIYEMLGNRGSTHTIIKYRNRFNEDLANSNRLIIGHDIPETLIPIINSFWSEAKLHAGDHQQIKIDRLNERLAEAESLNRAHQQKIAEQGKAIQELMEEKSLSELNEHQMRRTISNQSRQIEDLEHRLNAITAQSFAESQNHTKVIAQMEENMGLAVRERTIELEKELSKLQALKDTAVEHQKYDQERSQLEIDRLMRIVYESKEEERKLMSRIRDMEKLLSETKKRADSEIHIATSKATNEAIRADRLQHKLNALMEKLSQEDDHQLSPDSD